MLYKVKTVRNILLILLVLILLSILCVLSCGVFLFTNTIQNLSANLSAPRARKADLPNPRLVYNQLPGKAYWISWSKDDSVVEVSISNPNAQDTIVAFDLDTGTMMEYDKPRKQEEEGSAEELLREMPRLDEDHTFWSVCADRNIGVTGSGFGGEEYKLQLWEGDTLIKSFSFSSSQWPVEYHTPTLRHGFSPNCNKFVLVLDGWVAWESNGQEELWLLDVPSRAFGLAIMGRAPAYIVFDYPVQSVWPSWSPDEKEFVFGDGDFGLEIFDTTTSRRRWLAGPKYRLFFPQWSPSGRWIAAETLDNGDYNSVFVISPDGKRMGTAGKCDSITVRWAQNGDRLAYLCEDFDKDRDSLWVWELD